MYYYFCDICGNLVTSTCDCGEYVCCAKPMKKLEANTNDDASKEKHVPVYLVEDNVVCVKIGKEIHPSENDHYIEWINLVTNKGNYTKPLKPGDKPEVCFYLEEGEKVIEVKAYCNIHGLWSVSA